MRKSSTPVTVTTWGVSALAGVNTSDAGDTVPSVVSDEERPMVTFAPGTDFNATVKVAVPPLSLVTRPEVGVTVKPGAPTQQAGTEVWMVRRHPFAILPESPEKSSRTNSRQVPLGFVPLKAAITVDQGGPGAGA